MRVSYCKDDDCVGVEAIEKGVRKTREEAPSHAGFDFGRGERISKHKPRCAIQLVQEVHAFPRAPLLEPEIGFIDLLLSECEEPDVHLA